MAVDQIAQDSTGRRGRPIGTRDYAVQIPYGVVESAAGRVTARTRRVLELALVPLAQPDRPQ